LVDAAQSIPHMPLDVQALGADFAAFSAHKMVGPTGIGVMYGRRALLEAMPPFQGGGSMIDTVSFEKTTFAPPPTRFEAGTPAIAEAVGLAAAIDYLSAVGMEAIHSHERALVGYAMEGLSTIPGLRMIGPPPGERAGLVAFALEGVHPHDLAAGLDGSGIAVRAGHHCAMPLHTKFGLRATVRASFYLYNTFEEADLLVETVEKTRAFFAR
jgi:cysteine desulfurase/selenocysteine lyase